MGALTARQAMIAFIDKYRAVYGVEPICRVLPIAPSTYHEHAARRADPSRLPERERKRERRDAGLREKIRRVFDENFQVYGVRKIWRQLRREGEDFARCTVARLMRDMGLRGATRGNLCARRTLTSRSRARATGSTASSARLAQTRSGCRTSPHPMAQAPWGPRTYVATRAGFVYVAFVIDVFARRIVGWRASRTAHAAFVLDALEQALHDRRPVRKAASFIVRTAAANPSSSGRRNAAWSDCSASSSISAGVFHPSVLRGRALSVAATAARSSAPCTLRSVPFGKHCRSSPLVFSLVPRCHRLRGSQK